MYGINVLFDDSSAQWEFPFQTIADAHAQAMDFVTEGHAVVAFFIVESRAVDYGEFPSAARVLYKWAKPGVTA